MPKIDTLGELINCMFRGACDFVEFYDLTQISYYRKKGFTGKDPDKFHPGLADKFILRKMMEEYAVLISEKYWHTHNAPLFAQTILMNCYYDIFS